VKRIVECVPNFSEGRVIKTINAIGGAITRVAGVKFISAEPDRDYHRTVVTFVGEPDAVGEAAFEATRVAAELIDMSVHKGEHPRMGATDVVPFVPVSGISMDECVQLAHRYGKRVGTELGIPVYLYEAAATRPERKNGKGNMKDWRRDSGILPGHPTTGPPSSMPNPGQRSQGHGCS
jgi:glutamate formiminotransferase